MQHLPTVLLLSLVLVLWGCPGDNDDFSGDDDGGDDDTGDDDGGDDDGSDDDGSDDDSGDDDSDDDDTGDDDTGDDDSGDDDSGDDDDTGPFVGQLSASPPIVDFGVVYVGSSHQLGFQLDEAGTAAVTLSSTLLSGPNFDLFTATDLTGTQIPAGGSASVQVTYSPVDAGGHFAQYIVESDGVPSPLVVQIQGVAQWDLNDIDNDGDGFTENQGDCDDGDNQIYPGAAERCNGLDDNCDGAIPANETTDNDLDGYAICEDCNDQDPALNLDDYDGDGYDTCSGDCDDIVATVHPGMNELCNGIDDNCDGVLQPGEDIDIDNDGWPSCIDCDDNDPAMNFDDLDGDGYTPCTGDCDETDPAIHPFALELCNGVDDDCDPATSEIVDDDGDGYDECNGDCDDREAMIHPGANDPPNDGTDWDCDGMD